jgi:hypothetical protein
MARTHRRIDGRRETTSCCRAARWWPLDHIFKNQARVREAQIYQPDLTRVVFRLVKATAFTARDEQALLDEARTWLGQGLRIEVEYLDVLPRPASGKLRFVVSDVVRARLEQAPGMAAAS